MVKKRRNRKKPFKKDWTPEAPFPVLSVQKSVLRFVNEVGEWTPLHDYNAPCLLWIVSSINMERWTKPKKYKKSDCYVNLHSDYLSEILGKDYKRFITFGIQIGLLESDNKSVRNRKSIGYRLNKRFRGGTCVPFEVRGPYQLDARIRKFFQNRGSVRFPSEPHRLIYENTQALRSNLMSGGVILWKYLEENSRKDEDLFFQRQSAFLHEFASRSPRRFKIDDYGRIYSGFTQVKREIRPVFRLHSKDLYSADVSASHLADLAFNHPKPGLKEAKKMTELVCEGDIYSYLLQRLGKDLDRKEFKLKMIKVVHSHPERIAEDSIDARDVFQDEFPELWRWMVQMKTENWYKLFSREILRRESDLVIVKSVERLMKKNPRYPVLSLHDALYSFEENQEEVRGAIRASYVEKYGRSPKVKCDGLVTDGESFEDVRGEIEEEEIVL